MIRKKEKAPTVRTFRCAIYTRKSTEEGLEQEFNSLDAQRDAGESYIKSQQHEGWVCLPSQYDDGGFTGANMDRPALRRLLLDIDAGKVDCVVVYKVDRLSRSLLDFARIMETFERHNVSFVSVTQAFNTATSMGRLILNVLLSFAQFEREMISERTRDKIAAARRKGKWSGGMPILGYTVAKTKLVVDAAEARRVREIFALYLEHQSLLAVARELASRAWKTKRWTTRKGTERGGRIFDKTSLHQLLTNVVYIGKIRYKDEIHPGEHEPIVDADVFNAVQMLLARNGRSGGGTVRNKHGAILRGILRCAACDCAMSHSYSSKGSRRYRYYVCTKAQKQGWQTCPSPSVPAGEIERFVVEEIRAIGRDPLVIKETLAQARRQTEERIERLTAERKDVRLGLRDDHSELSRLAATSHPSDPRLADAHDRIRVAERRVTEIDDELASLDGRLVDESEVAAALADFDAVWNCLAPREQARVIDMLIEEVSYDGDAGKVLLTFRECGFKMLVRELARAGGRRMITVERNVRFELGRRKELREGSKAPVEPVARVPRISRLMALAIQLNQMVRDGVVADQAELARLGHVSRARLTQIMNLLSLAPDIQEELLFLSATERGRDAVTERDVRPIAAVADWGRQRGMWQGLGGDDCRWRNVTSVKQPKRQSLDSAGLAGFGTSVEGTDARKLDPLRCTGGGDRSVLGESTIERRLRASQIAFVIGLTARR